MPTLCSQVITSDQGTGSRHFHDTSMLKCLGISIELPISSLHIICEPIFMDFCWGFTHRHKYWIVSRWWMISVCSHVHIGAKNSNLLLLYWLFQPILLVYWLPFGQSWYLWKKRKDFSFSDILDDEPGQVSNMENEIIGKSGQRKRPEESANIVPALVTQAHGSR